jgi:dihydrofolate reductase
MWPTPLWPNRGFLLPRRLPTLDDEGRRRVEQGIPLGLIDEYEFVVHPRLAGHGPTLFAGLSKPVDLKLVDRLEVGVGVVAMRYEPRS